MDKIGFDNPILYYKLDPGEMGIASPSSAMLSVGHVSGHETGNAVRAYAEAVANGGYVIYSAITLDMRKRGAFLAAVSGKTTVEIYYPRGKAERWNSASNFRGSRVDTKELFQNIESKLKKALDVLRISLKNEKNPFKKAEIERRISQIENVLNSLRTGRIPLENIESLVNVYA